MFRKLWGSNSGMNYRETAWLMENFEFRKTKVQD